MTKLNLYIVGGAVRDVLLGKSPKDIDYVVVGSSPQEMLSLGFTQVGADFPVFLSSTGDEYALARTERKTSAGYQGFEVSYDPTVTVEDDLLRRDLTINAMAVRLEDWERFESSADRSLVVDPFGGRRDIGPGLLRHVSAAFAEDPLRVLRVARFQARFSNFIIAKETKQLMRNLVAAGEIAHLTPERVWVEFEKGFIGKDAFLFISTLHEVGALKVLMPELDEVLDKPTGYAVETAAFLDMKFHQLVGTLLLSLHHEQIETALDRLKAPVQVKQFAMKMSMVEELMSMRDRMIKTEEIMELFLNVGLYRQGPVFDDIMGTLKDQPSVHNQRWAAFSHASQVARSVTFASLTTDQQTTLQGKAIAQEIARLRFEAVKTLGYFT